MAKTIDTSIYYNPNKMLSYNRILNFIIGARGIGKTYGLKKHVINRAIKHGKQFIYLRRYKSEIQGKLGNFFNDIKDEFPGVELKVKGRNFYADGKLIGYTLILSSWQSEKGNAYPNVETILYDEFLREKDNSNYIPNEPNALLNLMDTVFRNRDNVRCICLSNAVTVVNPFFVYFNIVPDINKRFNKNESVLVEIPDGKDFKDVRKQSKFGKLVEGTDYADMAIENDFVNDTDTFIEKRTKESRFQFTMVHQGITMGVWVDREKALMYLSPEHDPSTNKKFCVNADDMTEGVQLVKGWNSHLYTKKMVSAFKHGMMRFDNQHIRTVGYDMFRVLNFR